MSLERQDPAASWSDRRAWERVDYPEPPRPRLRLGGEPAGTWEVLDCGERGVRVVGTLPRELSVGSDAQGVLYFPDGTECNVEGVVIRAGEDEFALHFTSLWLERDVILGEQRRLRSAARQD